MFLYILQQGATEYWPGMGTITFCKIRITITSASDFQLQLHYNYFPFNVDYNYNHICQLQLHYNYFLILARHNTQSTYIVCFQGNNVNGVGIKNIFNIL